MSRPLPRWEKLMLLAAWFALLGGLTWMVAYKPSITAFVPSEVTVQVLDIDVTQSTDFTISTDDPALLLNLKSFRVWGAVYGLGDVKVWLANDRGARLLVYSNDPKRGFESITALAVSDAPAAVDDRLVIAGGHAARSNIGMGVATAVVDGVCIETCRLPDDFRAAEYQLIVEVSDGTAFRLERVSYEV